MGIQQDPIEARPHWVPVVQDEYLDTEGARHFLCPQKPFAKATLEKWRRLGVGPDYVKLGGRVVYTTGALRDYVKASTRTTKPNLVGG